jgi:hypothetical protein
MVLSPDPEASVFPSGLKLTELTLLVCPSSVLMCLPVTASHRRMVESSELEASVFPSGLKAIALTELCLLMFFKSVERFSNFSPSGTRGGKDWEISIIPPMTQWMNINNM